MTKKLNSFPPVVPEKPKVLILGSMPGKISLEKDEYYGNPRNHFWSILFKLFKVAPIEEYDKKVLFVKEQGIALWDSIGSCYREGSLDSNIMDEVPNDIIGLLREYPSISLIACNGTKSYTTFKKNFNLDDLGQVRVIKLPSTSPIPGRYTKSFEGKVASWSEILNHI
ncbi:DNA-deoxyinosine glycosylase [Oceanobacillus polygoni]|uniref:TDG/mug DNA glycosylase family protein n=1 Tax=Oceanobacillus polygoni TaxID=1235259 RepID=A0A9X1CE15_9BACI|nr:DNA-deoxyinosine glycosylase [Oceanobacillus polygoni]MBP2076750.1 TDG/mug DNA glycosylase family protein [Oceanobacillus polygoni]